MQSRLRVINGSTKKGKGGQVPPVPSWEKDTKKPLKINHTDAKYHMAKTPEKCYRGRKGERSGCTWRHASSSVVISPPLSPQRMDWWGWRRRQILKRLAIFLPTKWKQTYSTTCGYVKIRIAINLVRANHRCIQGFGCRRTGSVYSGPSGKMAQGLTSSGKHARYHHINPPPLPPQYPSYTIPPPPTTTCRAGWG